MTRGKPVQDGVRVKLPCEPVVGATGGAGARRDQETERVARPASCRFRTRTTKPGGMIFPKLLIDETLKQTARDLTRFDLDFDLPDHLLPEFPAPVFLVTRPDLGDVSKGELITLDNFERLFKEILNPKQLEGLRLLVTPFPQQQFNLTEDRRSLKAHQGVACFDCHANGHTNAATHTVGDIRPNEFRHRIDTPSLRGVGVQRLFGSQRALKSVEDFTEFEQRAAYFDGDHTRAARKGVNPLERGSQVHFMGEFQNLLDFPPAPKLNVLGRLDPAMTSEAERRGEALFFGKAQCSTCHPAPYYTDNLMHNLRTERFYDTDHRQRTNGRRRRPDQDVPVARHQGLAAVPARRSAVDARRHRRVLQPRARAEAAAAREARPRGISSSALVLSRVRGSALVFLPGSGERQCLRPPEPRQMSFGSACSS